MFSDYLTRTWRANFLAQLSELRSCVCNSFLPAAVLLQDTTIGYGPVVALLLQCKTGWATRLHLHICTAAVLITAWYGDASTLYSLKGQKPGLKHYSRVLHGKSFYSSQSL